MKGFDHLRAAAAEARARGRQGADAIRKSAQQANPEAYEHSENAIRESLAASQGLQQSMQSKYDAGIEAAGKSAVGAAAGRIARRVGAIAGQLPVLSVTSDALREKHGIRVLADNAAADPANPMALVWLG